MKIIRGLAAFAAVGALTAGLVQPAFSAPNDQVSIPDVGLQECIAFALNVDPASSYTEQQLAGVDELGCSASDLTGLEYATGLTAFSAYGPDLTDVSALRALPLVDLDLSSERAIDLTPLAGKASLLTLKLYSSANDQQSIPSLPSLDDLELHNVPLSVLPASSVPKLTSLTFSGVSDTATDLSAMPALAELTELDLDYGSVATIPTLQLPKLTSLSARHVGLTDISGLSSLGALTTLDLRWNKIASIPATLELPNLQTADLSGNKISDLRGLPAMPALQRLDLDYNDLTTLPALDLPKLDWLGLAHNKINSISTTTALPELDAISLVANKLTNVAPLRSYPKVSTVFVNRNQITDLSNLTTVYPFKGQLHATRQRLAPAVTTKACTAVPLPAVKGAPDSKHPIVWGLPAGVLRSGSSIIYPEVGQDESFGIEFSQLGRFTRSDSRDDTYFSGYYSQRVQKATAILAPTPAVSGSVRYGSRVTVRAGSWCPAATQLAYQWLRNGAPIAKATGTGYTFTLADVGSKISVRVTGSRSGLTTVTKTSAQVVVASATLGAKSPSITGKAKKGKTLKVKMSAWTPAPVKITYQWLRNGSAISKATKSTYKVTKKDRKKYISVRVTGSKPGYATASRISAKTAKVK